MLFKVHALSLADEASVDLPLWQGIVNVFASLLLSNQFFVHLLCDLVLFVQVFASVLDAHTADDTVKQLWGRKVAHSLALEKCPLIV